MRYLFWNTHRNKNINSIICDLIIENDISVVALAEYTAEASDLIELLNMYGVLMERIPTIGCERIHILGRQGISISPGPQTDRTSIQVIEQDTILCCVHLNSQIYSGSEDRRQIDIAQIIYDLNDLEGKLDTTNTIVVGDFNINPYDISCISARYFHGIPVYEEAIRGSRTVAGRSYQTFYNPMWNFLGDFAEPYGTYYYDSGNAVNPYWNVFDQVIIRPTLRKRFVDNNLKNTNGDKSAILIRF